VGQERITMSLKTVCGLTGKAYKQQREQMRGLEKKADRNNGQIRNANMREIKNEQKSGGRQAAITGGKLEKPILKEKKRERERRRGKSKRTRKKRCKRSLLWYITSV